MKQKGIMLTCITICAFLALSCFTVAAAAPSLDLKWYKDNGYGMGNDINGQWTLNTEVSQDVTRVEFYLDGWLQLNDTVAPFSWSFNTGNYTEALHLFVVRAYNSDGEFTSQEAIRTFVGFPVDFVVGIIALIIITLVVALIGALIRVRKLRAKPKYSQP